MSMMKWKQLESLAIEKGLCLTHGKHVAVLHESAPPPEPPGASIARCEWWDGNKDQCDRMMRRMMTAALAEPRKRR